MNNEYKETGFNSYKELSTPSTQFQCNACGLPAEIYVRAKDVTASTVLNFKTYYCNKCGVGILNIMKQDNKTIFKEK